MTLLTLALLALALPGRVAAHPGHDHTVMGTVKAIQNGHLEVEAKDGKVSTFMLDGDDEDSAGQGEGDGRRYQSRRTRGRHRRRAAEGRALMKAAIPRAC